MIQVSLKTLVYSHRDEVYSFRFHNIFLILSFFLGRFFFLLPSFLCNETVQHILQMVLEQNYRWEIEITNSFPYLSPPYYFTSSSKMTVLQKEFVSFYYTSTRVFTLLRILEIGEVCTKKIRVYWISKGMTINDTFYHHHKSWHLNIWLPDSFFI